jgi:two-component system, OmpR family, response regulator
LATQNEISAMTTILVVNDDVALIKLYQLILEQQGYDVIGVCTSNEALEILNSVKPDVIITNIARYPIDGWEFILSCKTNPLTQEIPVIVASAQIYTPEKQQEYGKYINEYIQLVFTPDVLVDAIRKVLEKRNIGH